MGIRTFIRHKTTLRIAKDLSSHKGNPLLSSKYIFVESTPRDTPQLAPRNPSQNRQKQESFSQKALSFKYLFIQHNFCKGLNISQTICNC